MKVVLKINKFIQDNILKWYYFISIYLVISLMNFGFISLILIIISLCFGIPVLVDYHKTGLVLRFPTLICCTIALVIAILLWVTGIILSVITKKHKQLYELYLNILMKDR